MTHSKINQIKKPKFAFIIFYTLKIITVLECDRLWRRDEIVNIQNLIGLGEIQLDHLLSLFTNRYQREKLHIQANTIYKRSIIRER